MGNVKLWRVRIMFIPPLLALQPTTVSLKLTSSAKMSSWYCCSAKYFPHFHSYCSPTGTERVAMER
jgi:hypothetical protein